MTRQEKLARVQLMCTEGFCNISIEDKSAIREVLHLFLDCVERYRWRPVSEIHEDYGSVVLVNVADTANLAIGSNLNLDWDETLWTHFTRISPLGQATYEEMLASVVGREI